MGFLEAVVYGIIQGLTEFLPISSTAHLRIVPSVLGWKDPGSAFTAVIQFGTLIAVFVYFAKDLKNVLTGWIRSFSDKSLKNSSEARIGWGIFYGTIPIVILGVLLKKYIERDLRSLYVIAVMLIVMGIVLLAAEKLAKGKRSFEEITVKDGLIVGLFQAISLIPGASRSGSTITGALFCGLDRATAARYSFLLSVPSVLAAGIFEAVGERDHLLDQGLMPVLVASGVSFVVGYASIAFLIKFLQTKSFAPFTVYRIVLGVALLGMLSAGKLDPMAGIPPKSPEVSNVP
jgi:undecaprenyl-diphosphatase